MKITIYELLGLVKDGKAPKRIKHNYIYNFDGDDLYTRKIITDLLFECNYNLNDEVEILEQEEKKIPEKYEDSTINCMKCAASFDALKPYIKLIMITQNDIIDYLDYLKSKGDE